MTATLRIRSRASHPDSLCAVEQGQGPIECPKREVFGLPRRLQHEAVRETQRRPPTVPIECGRDNVSVLQAEMFVAEEHFNRRSDVAWTPLIHGGERPGGLGDSELWHPAPGAMNRSAASTCRASSLVNNRTRTLVSTARTPPLDVPGDASLQLRKVLRLGRRRKQPLVNVLRGKAAGAPDDDAIALIVPFEHKIRARRRACGEQGPGLRPGPARSAGNARVPCFNITMVMQELAGTRRQALGARTGV